MLSWSHDCWTYNCLCNQYLSPLKLWVRIPGIYNLDITLCDKICQWLATGQWFSPGTQVSSTNKTDCHNIAKILLNVVLDTITPSPTQLHHVPPMYFFLLYYFRSSPVDYNLYRRFWSLQDYFRKPVQCYEKIPWKQFVAVSNKYLNYWKYSMFNIRSDWYQLLHFVRYVHHFNLINIYSRIIIFSNFIKWTFCLKLI